ncbi:MAG: spore cortex-lytic enzyme [Clostridia bacterium]|nr:spore cortex-lytic enzyme [Clostridia bacterium]
MNLKIKRIVSVGVAVVFVIMCVVALSDAFSVSSKAAVWRQGSSGQTVRTIQTKLKGWGYYDGAVDGIYGSETTAAVRRFQRKNGLQVDGITGPETLAALGISSGGSSGTTNREAELEMLARIISAEGRGEPYMGQVAIGAVVMNRVRSASFPNTVAGVIYQRGAFDAVADGQFYSPATASSIRAAREAYNGADPTGGCLYYYNPKTSTNQYMLSKPVYLSIGEHNFCR